MDPDNQSWGTLTIGLLKSTGVGILHFFSILAISSILGLAVTAAIVVGAWSDPLVASVLGLVAFIAMLISATILSFKRSITVAGVHALRNTSIAPLTINFIFQGLVPDDSQTHGDRGHLATKASERLPLRQCEDALKARVQSLLSQPPEKTGLRAWIMRLTQTALLKAIAKLTLAQLRREDSSHGGVDLHKVRQALIHEAQVTLPKNLDAKIRLATLLGLTLPPALAALSALLAYWLLVRYLGA